MCSYLSYSNNRDATLPWRHTIGFDEIRDYRVSKCVTNREAHVSLPRYDNTYRRLMKRIT